MKVILLRDVAKIGRRHEVVEIPDGYAQNKLIPQRDAEPATPANLKKIKRIIDKSETHKSGQLSDVKNIAEKLQETTLEIKATTNEKGHLFKSVSVSDVVEAAKAIQIEVPSEFVIIDSPIKSLGEHKITLKAQNTGFDIKINIVDNK